MKTVLIADDHPIVRKGLIDLINSLEGYQVAGEADDGHAVLSVIQASAPDLLLLDLKMPSLDGLDVLSRLSKQSHPPATIVFTLSKSKESLDQAIALGAMGYLLKTDSNDQIIDCLDSVAAGQRYISPAISWKLLDVEGADVSGSVDDLTSMEKSILNLIAELKTSREMAEVLSISPRTVDTHRNNISRKLNLKGSHALLRYALSLQED